MFRVRREIQGLRAVAVLAVVLFHVWPNRFPGGYIGVDVFFVISGFLITSHMLREVDRTGRVRLAAFWARRARRLLPASYLVLLVTAAGIWRWVPTPHWQQFFKEIGAAALYVENWSLAADAVDYLAAENAPSPVQHYWTLSAEEQFYIVWPLLVLGGALLTVWWLRRRREEPGGTLPRGAIALVLGAVTVASLGYSLHLTATDPAAAYFVTPTRAWEFGAGALLSLVPEARDAALGRLRSGLSWAGLLIIAGATFRYDATTPMPGTAAIWVVLATAATIWAGDPRTPWSPIHLLGLRPAQYLGDISYSMYLWHWPLLILAPYALETVTLGRVARVGILLATIVLSGLSKRFVEDPMRRTQRLGIQRPARSLSLTAAGAAVLVAIGGTGWVTVQHRNDVEAARIRHILADPPRCFGAASRDPRLTSCPDPALAGLLIPSPDLVSGDYASYEGCKHYLLSQAVLDHGCQIGRRNVGVPRIALIGDSHARSLAPTFERLADQGLLDVELFTHSGCAWSANRPGNRKAFQDECMALNATFDALLARSPGRYDAVVTTAYVRYMTGTEKQKVQGLLDVWRPALDAGVRIIAVRDNPEPHLARPDLQDCMSRTRIASLNAVCGLDRATALDHRPRPFRDAVKAVHGASYIDMSRFYCDTDTCPVVIGGVNVYRDDNHITVTYQKTLAPYYREALTALGVLPGRGSSS